MPYLIDGHNLIAHLPALRLDDPHDEARLLALLRAFFRRVGTRATVYFDRRSPASNDPPSRGGVTAHFISAPRTADQAILQHLRGLGRRAANWTVVSSDNAIRTASRQAGARSMTSAAFSALLHDRASPQPATEKPNTPLTSEELEAWQRLFQPDAQK
jgi:predicted RNA-binding protein with PIN domain